MKTSENPQQKLPQAPKFTDVVREDNSLKQGYTMIDGQNLPAEMSIDTYTAGQSLSKGPVLLRSRTEAIKSGVANVDSPGEKTMLIEAGKDLTALDYDVASNCVFLALDATTPVVLLSQDASGYRLHLAGMKIGRHQTTGEGYNSLVDADGRNASFNLSLPFGTKNEALSFLKWLQSDTEQKLKMTIAKLAPALSKWSNAWKLREGFEDMSKALMIEEAAQSNDAKPPIANETKSARGGLFGLFKR